MKKYGNLYPRIYDMQNIETAHKNARKGKKHYHEVKMVNADPAKYLGAIQAMLQSGTFVNSPYKVFTKTNLRKTRVIHKLPYFPDRIIHHCIVQVLEPIWLKTFISNTMACIKGRGIHAGVKKIRKALHDDPHGTVYCLKMDVRKFYPSMDHDVLLRLLACKIKDKAVLWLLRTIINSTPSPGLPIGNYLSQYFGNLYLSPLDHYIKERLQCRHYFRYCDDMVILDGDKGRLHTARKKIDDYLRDNLCLQMKGDWQVFPVAKRGIDFLGYRFFPGYSLLRKSTAIQFKRKMAAIKSHNKKRDPISVVSSVMSYYGWMQHANCLHLWNAHVDARVRDIVGQACEVMKTKNPFERRFA